jgi:serine/threonine-protein kinase
MATVTHPGLVAVYDVGPGDPAAGVEPFVVMELCAGGSLAGRLADGRPMPPDVLVPIIVAVADALAALHGAGLVHRDVKPSNILFSVDRVKLGDFGLVQSGSDAAELTEPGTAIGTLAYLAPERLRGERGGPASDVHALATVTHLGLTGSLPRPAGSIRDVVAASAFRPPSVSAVQPSIGPAFDQAVLHGLAIDPGRRPDPLGFAAELTTALGVWTRAGRPGRDDGAPDAAYAIARTGLAEPRTEDDEPTTALALPLDPTASIDVGSPEPAAEPAIALRSSRARTSTGGRLVVAASLFAAVLLGAAIVGGLAARLQSAPGGALASGAASASSGPFVSASPGPSAGVGPSASPSPSASASPTPDPALAALDAMDRAIAAAKGGPDGLKGKEANELEMLVGRIRLDLERGQRDRALVDARTLESRARDAAKHVGDTAAGRLRSAAEAVVRALGG